MQSAWPIAIDYKTMIDFLKCFHFLYLYILFYVLIFFSNQFQSCCEISEKSFEIQDGESEMADIFKYNVIKVWYDIMIDMWLSLLSKQVWMLYKPYKFYY